MIVCVWYSLLNAVWFLLNIVHVFLSLIPILTAFKFNEFKSLILILALEVLKAYWDKKKSIIPVLRCVFIGRVEQTNLSNSVLGLLGLLWWSYFPGFVSLSIKIVLNIFINNLISCVTGMGFSGFYQILGISWNLYLYLWISPIFKRCKVIFGVNSIMSVINTCSFGFLWPLYHLQCSIALQG